MIDLGSQFGKGGTGLTDGTLAAAIKEIQEKAVFSEIDTLTGQMDLTAGGEPVSVGSAPPVAPSVAQRTIAFLGDSLTNVVTTHLLSNLEYSTHVLRRCPWLQSAGKFGTGGMGLTVAGTGGLTYAQAVASLRAVSPQPTDVMLLIGTNDLATNTAVQLIAALRAAVDELIGYGYSVIMSELTPRNDLSTDDKTKLHTVNTWINRHARLNNLRCNHFYSACVDTGGAGTWRSGYNGDAVHPTAAGADAMGAVAAATMTNYQWRPYLLADSSDTVTTVSGGLMLADVRNNGATFENAGDGIPDFFGKASAPAAGIVNSLVSGAGAIIGNWYQQVRTNQAGTPVLRSFRRAAAPGDVIAFGCVFDTDSAADGGTMSISACTATTTSWHDGVVTTRRAIAFGGAGYDSDVRECYLELVVPDGAVSTCVDIVTTASTSGGTFRVGQVTMRNLTALGIA